MEKKLIRIFVVFCIVTGFATKSLAQSLSTYEQKRYELADNTISAMAEEDASIALVWSMLRSQYIEENGPFEDFMSDVYFTESIIEAIGLGTSFMGTDSWAEYAQKQEFKRLYQSWKTQRDVLDRQRTAADIEHERRLKTTSKEPRGGTVEDLSFTLKKEFDKWMKKGKYEKTKEYEHRLNTKGIEYFDSLCFELSNKVWLRSEYEKSDAQYDADREVYSFILTYGDSVVGRKQIIGECNMPVEIAKSYEAKKMVLTEAQVVEGLVVPKRVSFWIKSKNIYRIYDFVFPDLPNATPLNICVNNTIFNLKGNVDTLRNHCFSLNNHYLQQKDLNRNLFETHLQTKLMFENLEKDYSDAVAKYDSHTSYGSGGFSEFDDWFKRSYDKADFEFMSISRCIDNYWCLVNDWRTSDVRRWLALPFESVEIYYTKEPNRQKKQYKDLLRYIDSSSRRLESKILQILNDKTTEKYEQIDNACRNVNENKGRISLLDPIGTAITYANQSKTEQMYFEGKIKKVIIEDTIITFIISKKEQIQCKLYANNLKLENNSVYSGDKRDDILCNNEGSIILYRTSINKYSNDLKGKIVLIVNEKMFILSDNAQQMLLDNGLFKESKTNPKEDIRY